MRLSIAAVLLVASWSQLCETSPLSDMMLEGGGSAGDLVPSAGSGDALQNLLGGSGGGGTPMTPEQEAAAAEAKLESLEKEKELRSRIERRRAEISAATANMEAAVSDRHQQGTGGGAAESIHTSASNVRSGLAQRKLEKRLRDEEEKEPSLRERIELRKEEKKTERLRQREADEAEVQSRVQAQTAARHAQPPANSGTYFRVDEGGAVAFRLTPYMEDRSPTAAQAGDLIKAIEMRGRPGVSGEPQIVLHPSEAQWVRHSNGLWLPIRFLVLEQHSPPQQEQREEVVQPAAAVAADADCVDTSPHCASWAQAGDCDKNLRYVHDTCPASCGLCSLRKAKASARQQQQLQQPGMAQAYPDAAAAAAAGMGATAVGAAGMSAAELELEQLRRQLQAEQQQQPQAVAATAPAATTEGGGARIGAPRLLVSVPGVIGAAESADVSLSFQVEPSTFELGRDGRACFDIHRAPLGILEETESLYHARKDEQPYVSEACFAKVQTITAGATPHGSYRVVGVLYSMDGTPLSSTEDQAEVVLFRVLPLALTAWKPSYDWQAVLGWHQLPQGIETDTTVPPPSPAAVPGQPPPPPPPPPQRRGRLPPSWSYMLRVAPALGELNFTFSRAVTTGDVRREVGRHALAAAAAVMNDEDASSSSEPPLWWSKECAQVADGAATVVVKLHHSLAAADGTEQLGMLSSDTEPLSALSAGWFTGEGTLVAVVEGCVEDGRLQRLGRRSEDDDVILEMVLQQFGLASCEEGVTQEPECTAHGAGGWDIEQLRTVLIQAVGGGGGGVAVGGGGASSSIAV